MSSIIVNNQNKAYIINGNAITIAEPEFHDYIVFDGVAYIDTDVVLPEDCSVHCIMGSETERAPQAIYGAMSDDGEISVFMNSSTSASSSGSRYFSARYCSTSSLVSNRTLAWSYELYTLFQTPSRFGFGNSSSTYTKGSSRPVNTLQIGWYTGSYYGPFTGKMRPFYIFGSDAKNATTASELMEYTPVYTLRPCIYLGEVGFWNEQESKFYGNSAGAGQLSVEDIE